MMFRMVYFRPLSSSEWIQGDFPEFLRQTCSRPFLYSVTLKVAYMY